MYRNNPNNPELLQTANNLRYKYHTLLKEATIKQNSNFLSSSKNVSKDSWNVINSNKSTKTTVKESIELNVHGNTISSCKDVVNSLNEFFINIPMGNSHNEQEKIEIISPRNNSTMYLDPVSPFEIHTIISKLKNKKSCGLDEISNVVLKKIGENLVIPLAHVMSLSLQSGIFPDCLKSSKVVSPLIQKRR